MKKMNRMLSILAAGVISGSLLTGCSGEEAPAIQLVSITADGVDLNGVTAATGVATGASIVATFNIDIDPASESLVKVIRNYDNSPLDINVTISGKQVTIDPATDFSTGTQILVDFLQGFKSKAGSTLPTILERTFTTKGTFAVPGAFAHWTFEDSGVDIIGGRGPASGGTVDVTYVAGRKSDAGKAASFNGTTSIMEIPNSAALVNSTNFSLSLWVKPNSELGKGHFVVGLGGFYGFQVEINASFNNFKMAGAYTNGTQDYSEDMWADGAGNLGWQGWTYSKDFGGTGMSPQLKDTWAHLAFIYNASDKTGKVYLNGVLVKSQDFDKWPTDDPKYNTTGMKYRGSLPDVKDDLAFGFIRSRTGTLFANESWGNYDLPTANHYHGLLDDVIVYHKALTEGEVGAMYNSGKP